MKNKCHCGIKAQKRLRIGDKQLDVCDSCAEEILLGVSKQLEKKGMAIALPFKGSDTGIIVGKNTCTRCNHSWVQRSFDVPTVCPKCKSPYWNREKNK